MKKNFKPNLSTSSTSISTDQFGFTAAKNILNIPSEPIISGQVNKKNEKKSKTWVNFFQRLNNNEMNDCNFNNNNNNLTEEKQQLSILDRLMKDDIGSFSNHKILNNQFENQRPKNLIDEGINSIFTKKGCFFYK